MFQTWMTRGIEMDDTHKVSFSGNALTVVGQSDIHRTFHMRSITLASNNNEEVGGIILEGMKALVPDWEPPYFIGDSAEAYANSAKAVFPSVKRRIMCSVHFAAV